jgi:prepilin-type N-terminal cleavage/methylation domain-containing protein
MGRRGFTMIEMAMVFTLIAIMTAMAIPRIGRIMQSNRVNGVISTVASDMEQAFAISARFRRPMRISCDCANGIYTVADVAGGTVRLRRAVVGDRDLGNMTLAFELPVAGIVDVFPSGVSTTPLRVRITSGQSTRAVTLSTAGQVRIIP